jgi:hypothetical protein
MGKIAEDSVVGVRDPQRRWAVDQERQRALQKLIKEVA